MKAKFVVIVFRFVLLCLINVSTAQESKLLPIPSEDASWINFYNLTNPEIEVIPAAQSFTIPPGTTPGNNHNEANLNAITNPPLNVQFLGQHPRFAQAVAHDNDGNVLFYIVDNNIYNRFGMGFGGGTDFLLDGTPTGPTSFLYSNIDVRRNLPETQYISMVPEIVLFPLSTTESCYCNGVRPDFMTL